MSLPHMARRFDHCGGPAVHRPERGVGDRDGAPDQRVSRRGVRVRGRERRHPGPVRAVSRLKPRMWSQASPNSDTAPAGCRARTPINTKHRAVCNHACAAPSRHEGSRSRERAGQTGANHVWMPKPLYAGRVPEHVRSSSSSIGSQPPFSTQQEHVTPRAWGGRAPPTSACDPIKTMNDES